MENMIEVTGVDLVALINAVYDNSKPIGMGFLHYTPGPLPEGVAEEIISYGTARNPVSMDYILGRACKFHVFSDNGKLYINDTWFDHRQDQLRAVLDAVGIDSGGVQG